RGGWLSVLGLALLPLLALSLLRRPRTVPSLSRREREEENIAEDTDDFPCEEEKPSTETNNDVLNVY
ncbi:MAG: hypothetical protein JXB10_01930, partial [Pirellulales bacterium]|nr:hypothetical protein [Pirellulales bacterium]